ncbi:hypothetical protein L083_7639 [Actinoplanes sp. N902-109]|nr:hypothetical protein L083_7639 [Actinoplanes sp. N902-109]
MVARRPRLRVVVAGEPAAADRAPVVPLLGFAPGIEVAGQGKAVELRRRRELRPPWAVIDLFR